MKFIIKSAAAGVPLVYTEAKMSDCKLKIFNYYLRHEKKLDNFSCPNSLQTSISFCWLKLKQKL